MAYPGATTYPGVSTFPGAGNVVIIPTVPIYLTVTGPTGLTFTVAGPTQGQRGTGP